MNAHAYFQYWLSDVLSRFLSSCHHRYTETVSATDLIPYLTTIVTPRSVRVLAVPFVRVTQRLGYRCLRAGPVVGTLVSAEDAKLVDRVVRVMLHYGLSYSPVTSQTKGEVRCFQAVRYPYANLTHVSDNTTAFSKHRPPMHVHRS